MTQHTVEGASAQRDASVLGEVRGGLTAVWEPHQSLKQCCWDLKAVLSNGTTTTSGKKHKAQGRGTSTICKQGKYSARGEDTKIPSLRLKDMDTATVKPVVFNWAWNDNTKKKKKISLA